MPYIIFHYGKTVTALLAVMALPLFLCLATCWHTARCKTAHFALQNGPFYSLKRPISSCEMARFANRFLSHHFLVRPALGVLLAFPLLMSDIFRATYLPIKPNQPIMPNQPIKPLRHAQS